MLINVNTIRTILAKVLPTKQTHRWLAFKVARCDHWPFPRAVVGSSIMLVHQSNHSADSFILSKDQKLPNEPILKNDFDR